jgi:plastocyanin
MKKLNDSKSRLLTGSILLFVILIISGSCTKSSMYNTPAVGNSGNNAGSSGGLVPGTNEVWIQNMAFNPSTISVTMGTTITWTNKDAVSHTVSSDNGSFDSGTLATNATFSYTFAATGTFAYHCMVHPAMTGSVIVSTATTPVTMPGSTPGY